MGLTVLTLIDALAEAADDHRPAAWFVTPAGDECWSRDELSRRAMSAAAALRSTGLTLGDRLALALWEPQDFIPAMLGAIWAGLVPVPLAPPIGVGREAPLADWGRLVAAAAPVALLTTDEIAGAIPVEAVPSGCRVLTLTSLSTTDDVGMPPYRRGPEEPVFLQFTSGSTSSPRGVVVTSRSLTANSEAIMRGGLAVDSSRDIGVSWLPMWHDMGLIGCVLAAVTHRLPVVYLPPTAYIRDPLSWLRAISRHRATVTFAPSSAYAAVSRRARRSGMDDIDLSSMRIFGCGAEPIQADVLRTFAKIFADAGLDPAALLPCYGLAEATLAVSFADRGHGFRSETVDARRLENERRAVPAAANSPIREVVSCGRPLPGVVVRIVGTGGLPLPDREVGEVVVAGPSVTGGYTDDAVASERTFRADGLRTGDLGYLVNGDLFLTGRRKDLLILGGRNVDPHAIEWVVADQPELRAGHCAAFSRPGTYGEEAVLVAETRHVVVDPEQLAAAIRRVVHEQLHVAVADVAFVPPRTLPRTTSGKIRRAEARRLYLDGRLTAEDPAPAAGRGNAYVQQV